MQDKVVLNKGQIEELLPHRDPFLLLDAVLLDMEHDTECSVTCAKQIKNDDWFFNGHFPDHPIMPGVLIVEALAQSSAVCAMLNMEKEHRGKPVFFTSIESAKFKKPVYPGCTLILNAKLIRKSRMFWKFECTASIKEVVHTTATITATIQK